MKINLKRVSMILLVLIALLAHASRFFAQPEKTDAQRAAVSAHNT